jgi:hypothetical protein
MSRGRSDRSATAIQHRQTVQKTFHGNSSIVARACDRFFMDRGVVIDGLRGLITREVRSHKVGRLIRDNKIDRAAADLEASWQS